MPIPSLTVSHNKLLVDISRLENYRTNSLLLDPKYQHLISEVILLRLFSLIENYVKDVCCKLACSATYRSGVVPTLLIQSSSISNALFNFENFNRRTQKNAKWTNSRFSIDTIQKVIPATEKVRNELLNFALFYDEMRKVRNHIAHRTRSTYSDYCSIIRATYGANLRINTGAFLVSTKRTPTSKIDYYLAVSKIFANSLSA